MGGRGRGRGGGGGGGGGAGSRKKPFSVKQKKLQLQERRARKQDGTRDHVEQTDTTTTLPQVVASLGRERGLRGGPVTYFARESKAEIEDRKREATGRLVWRESTEDLHALGYDPLPLPVRPAWQSSDSASDIQTREEKVFREWLEGMYETSRARNAKLNYFEHNLDVWRELWRVTERADVICVIADARFPAIHIPSTLMAHLATVHPTKPCMIVLTKIDLVTSLHVQRWSEFLRRTFPNVPVVSFSSTPPHAKTVTKTDTSGLMRRARTKRRQAAGYGTGTLLNTALCLIPPALMESRGVVTSNELTEFVTKARMMPLPSGEIQHALSGGVQTFENTTFSNVVDPSSGDSGNESDADSGCKRSEDRGGMGGSATVSVPLPETQGGDGGRARHSVSIGLIGHPNCGKSSVLNALMGRKVVSTSRTPGHTKHLQTHFVSHGVVLIDCPGIVWPALNLPKQLQVLCGLFPISQLREPFSSIQFLAERVRLDVLYALTPEQPFQEEDPLGHSPGMAELAISATEHEWSAYGLLEALARKRGFVTGRVGRLDVARAANTILRDVVDGRVSLCFGPPT